jgi:hypothetical protein
MIPGSPWPSARLASFLYYKSIVDDAIPEPGVLDVFGFDPFWYAMEGVPVPCKKQLVQLRERMVDVFLTRGPEAVAAAAEKGQLKSLVGPEFAWVVVPILKR